MLKPCILAWLFLFLLPSCPFFDTFKILRVRRYFYYSPGVSYGIYRIMKKFIHEQQQGRVIFGLPLMEALAHELTNGSEADAWVIASHRFDPLVHHIDELQNISVLDHFSRVLQHVPADQVHKARHAVAKSRPDIIIAIGGGSAIGLAKAVALKHPLPIWAVPTTYSGSEMTNIYGISTAGKKMIGRDYKVLPKKVFYDPDLSLSLPFDIAAKSAVNALAHLIEAVYSRDSNPFTFLHSLEGLRLMSSGIETLAEEGALSAINNEKLLLGASFAGKSLSENEMALHHKCAHVIGGSYGLDHALVHTVMLPFVLSYQWQYLTNEVKGHFNSAFNSDNPASTLLNLVERLGLPTSLQAIGFSKNDAAKAATEIAGLSFKNPAPVTRESIQTLLEQACEGQL